MAQVGIWHPVLVMSNPGTGEQGISRRVGVITTRAEIDTEKLAVSFHGLASDTD
jgi:L-cysteine desulfidase